MNDEVIGNDEILKGESKNVLERIIKLDKKNSNFDLIDESLK
jgi:hypothetical protein